jgi:hypothetical protein
VVSNEVKNYLSTRYGRLLEYANYHAGLAGLDQQGGDVLNEVLLNLLAKDQDKITALYRKKKGGYRELDYFILRMIKLNCHSQTSPYRFKYKLPKKDENTECPEIEQSDLSPNEEFYEESDTDVRAEEEYEESDPTELICKRFNLIRDIVDKLPVTEREKEAFRHKFFAEESWNTWNGKESVKWLQTAFKKVKALIINKIDCLRFSYSGIIAKSSYQIERVKNEYSKTLFPGAYRYSKRYIKAIETKTKYQLLLNLITGNYE